MQSSQPAEKTNVSSADLCRATWTCSLGGALEYYDFVLYNLVSAIISGSLLFPNRGSGMALIASFSTYFLGFAVRPVGGTLFGSLGDRLGRKLVLSATMLLMGIASTLTGVLPTYEIVGIWAPITLIVLRLLQGLGAGAEQVEVVVLTIEYAPDDKRGHYIALPFLGIQVSTLVASVVYFILLHSVTNLAETWWQCLPFLSSVAIIAVAIYIRLHLKESPSPAKLEARQQAAGSPLRNLLETSRHNIFIGIGLYLAENGGSSIYQALVIGHIIGVVGLNKSVGTSCLMSAIVVGTIMVPITGWLVDCFGRVLVYRSLAVFQLLITFPVWWFFSHDNVPITIVSLSLTLGVGTWGMFGVQGAFLSGLFDVRHRYIGITLARGVSAVIAERIASLVGSAIASWMIHINDLDGITAWIPIAIYLSLPTVGTIIAAFFAPETHNCDLDDPASVETISIP